MTVKKLILLLKKELEMAVLFHIKTNSIQTSNCMTVYRRIAPED